MSEQKKLKEKADEIVSLLMRITSFYNECRYLNTTTDNREQSFINRNDMLKYARFSILLVMILDLCTLYNEKEHYSIVKFFNAALNNHKKLTWKNEVSKRQLTHWIESFNDPKLILSVEKILELRDQHYAHLDYDRSDIDSVIPSFIELDTLINHVVNTFNAFYSSAFNCHLLMALPVPTGSEELLGMLKQRDDWYKQKELELGLS